ncbi:MAG: putative tRNA/rRNA methyltransferase YsgA [Desulfotomaculum sp. 46_296]|nr:MAG: putative tRNA/rRNA methyltransferase YsgA [Desulfotomaculum sp. 46_296]KUK84695.1 MAG: putative tRNA/rRNA methyltransferase YsgA [Desulfofundulus kuznetsovii]HAU30884.1 RNA methyltransferase [Desulfotomaculum sp.]
MPVNSLQNPRVKYISRLYRPRFGKKEGKFVIEGSLMVSEALQYNWPAEQIVCTPAWLESPRGRLVQGLANAAGIELVRVSQEVFEKLSATETPQGVLAVLKRCEKELDQLAFENPTLVVLVDGVQDPGNVGTIIRSADAAGAQGVILLKGTADLYNPKTLRATMGSLFHIPVIEAGSIVEAQRFAKTAGLRLVAGSPSAKQTIISCDLKAPAIIAVGSESGGCSEELLSICDHVVKIPMPGLAESLNAAVAVSIILYEAVRQRFLSL